MMTECESEVWCTKIQVLVVIFNHFGLWGDFGYIWLFWLLWVILVTSGDGMSKWGVRAPEFQSDVQEPPGVNGWPASDSKLWINYLFLTKAPPDPGSNSALIWRFPVADSQVVCGSWALNGRRGGLIVDTWPSGHGPKIKKIKNWRLMAGYHGPHRRGGPPPKYHYCGLSFSFFCYKILHNLYTIVIKLNETDPR